MTAAAVPAGHTVYARGYLWIGRVTTISVAVLAGIAALVSYGHMHQLALAHGEGAGASALIPLSVDGMIAASSMSLLLDSRLGRRGGTLPWALLIIGAAASLAANIAVAEPTLIGRVIAAWPSFALTASYELLMRQVRHAAQAAVQAAGAAGHDEGLPGDDADPGSAAAGPGPAGWRCPRVPGERAGVGCYSGGRGSGRWLTGGRTGRFRPGPRWPASSAAATGGAAWSLVSAVPNSSPPPTRSQHPDTRPCQDSVSAAVNCRPWPLAACSRTRSRGTPALNRLAGDLNPHGKTLRLPPGSGLCKAWGAADRRGLGGLSSGAASRSTNHSP